MTEKVQSVTSLPDSKEKRDWKKIGTRVGAGVAGVLALATVVRLASRSKDDETEGQDTPQV